jgi:hypothetical protein
MKPALPIVVNYKCPYCGRVSDRQDDIIACVGMCHLASLIEEEMIDPQWTPPLTLNRFKEWGVGDKTEFARRLDNFARKYYTLKP